MFKLNVDVRFGDSVFTFAKDSAVGTLKEAVWYIEINELNEYNIDVCKGLENLWDATDRLESLNRLQRTINKTYNDRYYDDRCVRRDVIAEAEAFLREVEGKTCLAESLLVLKEGQVSDYQIFTRNGLQSVNWIYSLIEELKSDLEHLKGMVN